MKAYYLLLFVGFLGLTFSGYSLIAGKDITTHLIGFICGASLILAFFELRKEKKG